MTPKQVARIFKMRDEGKTYKVISQALGVSQTTVRRYCQLDQYANGCDVAERELPFIATQKTCGGCMYFKKLHPSHKRENFCAYTLMTGKAKDITVPCSKCKLKRKESKSGDCRKAGKV